MKLFHKRTSGDFIAASISSGVGPAFALAGSSFLCVVLLAGQAVNGVRWRGTDAPTEDGMPLARISSLCLFSL